MCPTQRQCLFPLLPLAVILIIIIIIGIIGISTSLSLCPPLPLFFFPFSLPLKCSSNIFLLFYFFFFFFFCSHIIGIFADIWRVRVCVCKCMVSIIVWKTLGELVSTPHHTHTHPHFFVRQALATRQWKNWRQQEKEGESLNRREEMCMLSCLTA